MVPLTPPRLITFVISVLLAAAVLASLYLRLPVIGAFVGSHRLALLGAAYVVLALGVVLRGF